MFSENKRFWVPTRRSQARSEMARGAGGCSFGSRRSDCRWSGLEGTNSGHVDRK